jgi:starvation-inducible DNA-binding protein
MLADNLKVLVGSTFVVYTKTHGFHWNIEGPDFPQYHKFLKKMYEQIYETIDTISEYVRTLDVYTPGNLARMLELSIIEEQTKIPRAELMMAELLKDCEKMTQLVVEIFDIATRENQQGIANYMAELQDLYTQKAWMLRSILKKSRA